jgi:uncharacterized protein YndB with AHSA1/START domain
MQNDWSSFRLRVNIGVSPEKVYAAWATPAGLESWFLRQAGVVAGEGAGSAAGDAGDAGRKAGSPMQKGDSYEWQWHGYPDSLGGKGRITAANGTNQFAFTFATDCLVNISIFRECEETIVELTESGLPEDTDTLLKRYAEDYKGWIFYLVNLKSVLEGGLDLRNRKVELTNVITA